VETPRKNCTRELVAYLPSDYEKLWYTNLDKWKSNVCATTRSEEHREAVNLWMKSAGVLTLPHDPLPTAAISQFVFSDSCTNAHHSIFIEPIAGLTRSPRFCGTQGKELEYFLPDKDYLAIDCSTYKPGAKAWYFDLGATTWMDQSWFHSSYNKCGVKFDGYYMWEVQPLPPGQVWATIPAEVKPYYHWYNVPANPAKDHSDNPLRILRQIAKPEDFVLLKIDIDHSVIEWDFVTQILEEPDLIPLLDDFYFEHHVNVHEMEKYWGLGQKHNLDMTYTLFRRLRNAGVRAHSWI